MARRGYIGGTAAAFGVGVPSYQGDTSSGGLLILLVGAYLLLAFVTGRLSWLTNTISDTFTAYNAGSAPSTTPSTTPSTEPGAPGSPYYGPPVPPGYQTTLYGRPRPRTAGVYV